MGRSIVNRSLGLGDDCISPRKGGSTPYYQFGTQRKYAYAWHGGPGGVPTSSPAAESRELGLVDLEESGLNPYSMAYPALSRTSLHSGGQNTLGMFDGLSRNEKFTVGFFIGAVGTIFLMKKYGKRRR